MGGTVAEPVHDYLQSLGDADDEPSASLADAEAAALVGTYIFGFGASQQIEITQDKQQYATKMYTHGPQLTWTRKGSMGRYLFHLGNRIFYPCGAPAVRIKFVEEPGAIVMTVTDGDPILTARRKLEGK